MSGNSSRESAGLKWSGSQQSKEQHQLRIQESLQTVRALFARFSYQDANLQQQG